MINIVFYVLTSLFLIIAQTSFLPVFSFFDYSFDLLIINVLCLSFLFSSPLVIVGILLLGLCMDSISGAPFGVYTSAYIWIYFFIQAMRCFVHYGNMIFVPMVSALSVLMENGFLFFTFFVSRGRSAISVSDLVMMGKQMFFAFFMLPVCIMLIHILRKRWEYIIKKYAGK